MNEVDSYKEKWLILHNRVVALGAAQDAITAAQKACEGERHVITQLGAARSIVGSVLQPYRMQCRVLAGQIEKLTGSLPTT